MLAHALQGKIGRGAFSTASLCGTKGYGGPDNGQFVISNVPATAGTAGTTTVAASTYQVTVDLRQVKTAAGAAKYPDFSFTAAPVTFGTLNDGSDTTTGTSASNHATRYWFSCIFGRQIGCWH